MKTCRLLTLRLGVLFLLSTASLAFAEEHSPLHDEMEAMNRNFRRVNRQAADPAQKDSTLQLVAAMRGNVEKAKTLIPPQAEKLDGEKKTDFLKKYQDYLDKLGKEIDDLESALKEDNADKVKSQLDTIRELKKTSHKDLGVEDEKRRRP